MANLVPKNVDIGEKGGPKFKRAESTIFWGVRVQLKNTGIKIAKLKKLGDTKIAKIKLGDQNCKTLES